LSWARCAQLKTQNFFCGDKGKKRDKKPIKTTTFTSKKMFKKHKFGEK
jgi:hypothetical protein